MYFCIHLSFNTFCCIHLPFNIFFLRLPVQFFQDTVLHLGYSTYTIDATPKGTSPLLCCRSTMVGLTMVVDGYAEDVFVLDAGTMSCSDEEGRA